MDFRDNQFVVERIVALQVVLQQKEKTSTISVNSTTALLRLLKRGNSDQRKHVRIIKQLLDKKLFAEEGPNASTQFNQQYELCLKINPMLTENMLLFLKPLSFYSSSQNGNRVMTIPDPVQSVRNLSNNISNFQTVVNQTQNRNFDIQQIFSIQSQQSNEGNSQDRSNFQAFGWKNPQTYSKEASDLQTIDQELIHQKLQKQQHEPISDSEKKRKPPLSTIDWIPAEMEQKLIHDLIYILGGVNGHHIKYDPRTEAYVIDPTLSLHPTVRDIVLYICELGWLYQRINQYREMILQSSTNTKGLVVQAFAYAINVSHYHIIHYDILTF